jgi:hypothetical protein
VTVRVYAYDLVPTRTHTNWTRQMDDWLRANYFPGLSIAVLTLDARHKFPMRGTTELNVTRRLEDLGLYSRRKARKCNG